VIDRDNEGVFGFRELIASVFIITFLLLLTSEAFFHVKLSEGNLTSQLVNNFTTLTGVVVGAYFGATAIEKVSASRNRATKEANADIKHDGQSETLPGPDATASRAAGAPAMARVSAEEPSAASSAKHRRHDAAAATRSSRS
jgi:hypothetical protein